METWNYGTNEIFYFNWNGKALKPNWVKLLDPYPCWDQCGSETLEIYCPVTFPHRFVSMVDGYDPNLDISKPFMDPVVVPNADP